MALVLENARDEVADVGLVVDDQDVCSHRSKLLGSISSGLVGRGLFSWRMRCRRACRPVHIDERQGNADERAVVASGAGGASSRDSVPPCCSVIFCTMARPRPVPLWPLVVTYGSSRRARFCLGRPMPLSMTSMVTRSDCGVTIVSTRPFQFASPSRRPRAPCFHRLAGVLDEVGHGARDQAPDRTTSGAACREGAARSGSPSGLRGTAPPAPARHAAGRGSPSPAWACARTRRIRRPCVLISAGLPLDGHRERVERSRSS